MQRAGDAEVHHLDRTGVGDDHVGGLDVAVHDAVLVRVGERLQHPGDDDQRLLRRRGLGVDQQVADRAALDELHHDVRDRLAVDGVLAGVVDRHDRMVVEPGDRLRLAREAGLGDRVLGEVGAQQLHRDRAPQPDVLRREHLGHAAPAEAVGQPVPSVADDPADAEGFGAIRNSAAVCFGFGCHQSSPSFLSALSARPRGLTVPCCVAGCTAGRVARSRYSLCTTGRSGAGPAIQSAGAPPTQIPC